jgi:hypothetical protein
VNARPDQLAASDGVCLSEKPPGGKREGCGPQ